MMGYSPYQLVQDFFHKQYDMKLVESLPETLGITKGMLGGTIIFWNQKIPKQQMPCGDIS